MVTEAVGVAKGLHRWGGRGQVGIEEARLTAANAIVLIGNTENAPLISHTAL